MQWQTEKSYALERPVMVCSHQTQRELFTQHDYRQSQYKDANRRKIHVSWKILTRARNSHDAVSWKPISTEILQTSLTSWRDKAYFCPMDVVWVGKVWDRPANHTLQIMPPHVAILFILLISYITLFSLNCSTIQAWFTDSYETGVDGIHSIHHQPS